MRDVLPRLAHYFGLSYPDLVEMPTAELETFADAARAIEQSRSRPAS